MLSLSLIKNCSDKINRHCFSQSKIINCILFIENIFKYIIFLYRPVFNIKHHSVF